MLEDYARLVYDITEYSPDALLLSGALPSAFQATLSTITLYSPAIVVAALDSLRAMVGHEALQYDPSDPSLSAQQQQAYPTYAAALRSVIGGAASQLVGVLMDVLVDGVEDASPAVLTVLRLLAIQFPAELQVGVIAAVDQLPSKVATAEEKAQFMDKFTS